MDSLLALACGEAACYLQAETALARDAEQSKGQLC